MKTNLAKKKLFSLNLYRENGEAAVVGEISSQRRLELPSRNVRKETRETMSMEPMVDSVSHDAQANTGNSVRQDENDDDFGDQFNCVNYWKIPIIAADVHIGTNNDGDQLSTQVLANNEDNQPILRKEVN